MRGEAQRPIVSLDCCQVHLDQVYLNVPAKGAVTLRNQTLLATRFRWNKQVSAVNSTGPASSTWISCVDFTHTCACQHAHLLKYMYVRNQILTCMIVYTCTYVHAEYICMCIFIHTHICNILIHLFIRMCTPWGHGNLPFSPTLQHIGESASGAQLSLSPSEGSLGPREEATIKYEVVWSKQVSTGML